MSIDSDRNFNVLSPEERNDILLPELVTIDKQSIELILAAAKDNGFNYFFENPTKLDSSFGSIYFMNSVVGPELTCTATIVLFKPLPENGCFIGQPFWNTFKRKYEIVENEGAMITPGSFQPLTIIYSDYFLEEEHEEGDVTHITIRTETPLDIEDVDFSEKYEIFVSMINDIYATMHLVQGIPFPTTPDSFVFDPSRIPIADNRAGSKAYENFIRSEIQIIKPTDSDITLEDMGGNEDLKRTLEETILLFKNPDVLTHWNTSIPKGILMEGAPGTGKTSFAKAIAHDAGVTFMNIPASLLRNKWFGESEARISALFNYVKKVIEETKTPVILFFDEIDDLGATRTSEDVTVNDSVVSSLLQEIEGINSASKIFILAATNRPELVDPALLRPGRLDIHFRLNLPTKDELEDILFRQIAKVNALTDERRTAKEKVEAKGSTFLSQVIDPTVDIKKLVSILIERGMEFSVDITGAVTKEILQRALRKKALLQIKTPEISTPIGLNDLIYEIVAFERFQERSRGKQKEFTYFTPGHNQRKTE